MGVGRDDGKDDGETVGIELGDDDGIEVGGDDGAGVGVDDGAGDGGNEGAEDGDCDGAGVGAEVGAGVGGAKHTVRLRTETNSYFRVLIVTHCRFFKTFPSRLTQKISEDNPTKNDCVGVKAFLYGITISEVV